MTRGRPAMLLACAMLASAVVGCATQGPAKTATAFVLTSDSKPAPNATVVLVAPGQALTVSDAETIDEDNSAGYTRLPVEKDGRIRFSPPDGAFFLVAIHPSGYAQPNGTGKTTGRLVLQPWARVEGRLMVGDKPDVGKRVSAWPDDLNRPPGLSVTHDLSTTTGADGRFVFERVPPGPLVVGRYVEWTLTTGVAGTGFTQRTRVDAKPGQTLQLQLGGTGRTITGNVFVPRDLGPPGGLEFGVCKVTAKPRVFLSPDDSARRTADAMFPVELSHVDGSFRVTDMPAGEYEIHVEVRATTRHPARRAGDILASGRFPFTVPGGGGPGSGPLKLPTIPLHLHTAVPRVGDAAPDFTAKRLEGGALKLSDLRGRYVLMNFWATTSKPSLEQTSALKALHDEFGKDGRLTMIGLSTDLSRGAPLRFTRQQQMNWDQCFVGPDGAVASQYGVNRLPSTWLIAPDGRVIANGVGVDRLRDVVRTALTHQRRAR